MKRSKSRSVASLLAVSSATLIYAVANSASADPFGTGTSDTGYEPDNMNHWGCWEPGGATLPAALYDAFWIDVEMQTNVEVFFDNPCNSVTDVRFNENLVDNVAPITLGLYTCLSFNGQGECEASRVNFNNTYYVNNAPDYYCNSYHNWCHELGHSMGLSHDQVNNNCLKSGMLDGCSGTIGRYTAHHVSHINNNIN